MVSSGCWYSGPVGQCEEAHVRRSSSHGRAGFIGPAFAGRQVNLKAGGFWGLCAHAMGTRRPGQATVSRGFHLGSRARTRARKLGRKLGRRVALGAVLT